MKRSARVPVNPAIGSAASSGRSCGIAAVRRLPEQCRERCRGDGVGSGRARSRRRSSRRRGGRARRATCPSAAAVPANVAGKSAAQRDLPSERFGDVGVAVVQHPLDQRRDGRAFHRGEQLSRRPVPTPTAAAPVRTPAAASASRKLWAADEDRVVAPRYLQQARGVAALVHLERPDPGHLAFGEVVRRPARREIRAGVGVADADDLPDGGMSAGDRAGERGEVGGEGIAGGQRLRRQRRVAAADQVQVRAACQHPRRQARIRSEHQSALAAVSSFWVDAGVAGTSPLWSSSTCPVRPSMTSTCGSPPSPGSASGPASARATPAGVGAGAEAGNAASTGGGAGCRGGRGEGVAQMP